MGVAIEALIQVNLHQHQGSNLHDFIEAVPEIPEVMECYLMTGESDYLIRVVVADIQILEDFILNFLSKIMGKDLKSQKWPF